MRDKVGRLGFGSTRRLGFLFVSVYSSSERISCVLLQICSDRRPGKSSLSPFFCLFCVRLLLVVFGDGCSSIGVPSVSLAANRVNLVDPGFLNSINKSRSFKDVISGAGSSSSLPDLKPTTHFDGNWSTNRFQEFIPQFLVDDICLPAFLFASSSFVICCLPL
ncbi:hypothetical protein MA16_Dca009591 [Dendrobium catenatum]|uniref:Uncharacterized protein n=1 Tax=Dendrobium catenatum TaxID=906689 RepID=A0A2I0VS36_9ASPA|nr:hypothetical protein MA16_Dca009591 [Dendrobium catenatum]